jgi:hypothetical protein
MHAGNISVKQYGIAISVIKNYDSCSHISTPIQKTEQSTIFNNREQELRLNVIIA